MSNEKVIVTIPREELSKQWFTENNNIIFKRELYSDVGQFKLMLITNHIPGKNNDATERTLKVVPFETSFD